MLNGSLKCTYCTWLQNEPLTYSLQSYCITVTKIPQPCIIFGI